MVSEYRGFNIQKLRMLYSSLPVMKHHLTVIPHGRQLTRRIENFEKKYAKRE